MKTCKSKWALLGVLLLASLVLASCAGHLPRSVRQDVAFENDRLLEAEHQVQRSQERVRADLSKTPDLFRDASEPAQWDASLKDARAKLDEAQRNSQDLAQLARSNRADSLNQVDRLLTRQRDLRSAATREAATAEAAADKWIDIQQNTAFYLDKMNRERAEIRGMDLEPVSKTVHQAEIDWPAKKTALDSRLAALHEIPASVEEQWAATEAARSAAAAGKLTGAEVSTLIREENELSEEASAFPHQADDLRSAVGQLYVAWDKILVDLDAPRKGGGDSYREEIRTVRTRFIDVSEKKTETSSDEQWVDISEPAFHSVENDLGMAIAHKDAGLFDSEAQTTPEPAGFAYVASPSQGSNQYGYWTTNRGGESVWAFLPQYLLLRELMWGHNYQPIVIGEYSGYRAAQSAGRVYYGQETPTSAPKYGSHGTFTQTRYAQSRYVQSGGFTSSAYASRRGSVPSSPFAMERPGERSGGFQNSGTAGRRFGSPPGSQGKRFGAFHSPGRRFGRR